MQRKLFLLLRRDFDFSALMKFFPTEVFLMIGPLIPEIPNGKESVHVSIATTQMRQMR